MGRGRGKGKKAATGSDETGSGPEEVIPTQKRRGRPQKPLKHETDEEEEEEEETLKTLAESEKKENGDTGKVEPDLRPVSVTSTKKAEEIAKKRRKKQAQVKEETKSDAQTGTEAVGRANGFRHSGSRRKSKPRRAAEAGIRCDW